MRWLIMLLIMCTPCLAAEVPSGTWRVEQIAIDIYPCQGAACGKIVWLQNKSKQFLCGRVIIWGLTPDAHSSNWTGGRFYNPEDEKTYDLQARVDNHDRISARIYAGIPLIGRTEILTRIQSHSLTNWCD